MTQRNDRLREVIFERGGELSLQTATAISDSECTESPPHDAPEAKKDLHLQAKDL